jgi:hypothetical protein
MDESLGRCAMPTVNKGQTPTTLWHCCGAENGHVVRLRRHAVETSHGWPLWCELHPQAVVSPCRWWEREVGADDTNEQDAPMPEPAPELG